MRALFTLGFSLGLLFSPCSANGIQAPDSGQLLKAAYDSIAAGDLPRALSQAKQAQELVPADARPALLIGEIEARLGRTEAALRSLERAAAIAPQEPSPYLLGALLLRDDDRVPEAIALLERAPETPSTLELLALLHLSQGSSQAALNAAERGFALDPTVDLEFARAMALVAVPGRDAEAMAALDRLLSGAEAEELSPLKRGQAHLELAALLGRSEDPEQAAAAAQHFESAQRFMPQEKEVPFRLASYLRQQGDSAGARAALERYQQLDQEQASASQAAQDTEKQLLAALRTAQSQANDNRLGEALASLDQAPEASRNDARWRLLHAKILFSMNRAEEALVDLGKARDTDPSNLEAPYIEAIVTRSLGRNEQARELLEGLLTLAPDMAEAHFLLAVILADQGKLHSSVESYERAIELGASSPALRAGLEAVRKQLESEEN